MGTDVSERQRTRIIVLLGHRTDVRDDPDRGGQLSESAERRCDKAVSLATDFRDSVILPTGGFGARFNTSNRAHGELLRDYLLAKQIPVNRILPHLNSASPVEDALFARKVAVDLEASAVMVVTSDFHMSRAEHIFRRIFPDAEIELTFHESPSQFLGELAPSEASELRLLKAEWVDVPLYRRKGHDRGGDGGRAADFPVEIYDGAAKEQKHYDTLSSAFISGAFIIFGAPYASTFHAPTPFVFLASGILVAVLLIMYWSAALWARTARRIMQNIEAGFGQPGFALNSRRQHLSEQLSCLLHAPRFLRKARNLGEHHGFVSLITWVVGAMVVIQFGAALFHMICP